MEYRIRRATAQDYDALCAIIDDVDALHRENLPGRFQQVAGPVRDRAYILDLIADEDACLFVAEADGEVVGFVNAGVSDTPPIPVLVPRRVATIDNLAVREDKRRTGIGRALMKRVQRWAAAREASEVELTVYAFNKAAIEFYHSLGYEATSQRMSRRLGEESNA